MLVVEGIHGLNERLTASIPANKKMKIYVSALTPMSINVHHGIHTTDARLLRRMVRDALLVSPYITEVDGFSVSQSGSTVTVACTVRTIYDSFETEVTLE